MQWLMLGLLMLWCQLVPVGARVVPVVQVGVSVVPVVQVCVSAVPVVPVGASVVLVVLDATTVQGTVVGRGGSAPAGQLC